MTKKTESQTENMALYRKYRPADWDDVLGQEQVVSILKGAIQNGNVAHAYLFSGSRGTGKTSVARILAKALDTFPEDVYEMDGASNRKIEHIRELKESVHTLPFRSPFKVYIIDEVHMLTTEAFNALLKTLEEPPKHVLFILATTELDRLPETIISRCQVFQFKRPSQEVLKRMVLSVAEAEGFELDAPSGELIASLSDGSFRDAHGILQKIFASSRDKKISRSEIEAVVSAPSNLLINDIVEAIAYRDTKKGLDAISRGIEEGRDMNILAELLVEKLRAVFFFRYDEKAHETYRDSYPPEDIQFLARVSKDKEAKLSSDDLRLFLDALLDVKRSPIPHLPIEIALLRTGEKI